MKPLLFCLIAVVAILDGCPYSATPQKVVRVPQTPTHRFVITRDLDVAFDTQTGQLCRTWDWSTTGSKPTPDKNGIVPKRATGELTPTCISLYKQYRTGPNGESAADQETQGISPY